MKLRGGSVLSLADGHEARLCPSGSTSGCAAASAFRRSELAIRFRVLRDVECRWVDEGRKILVLDEPAPVDSDLAVLRDLGPVDFASGSMLQLVEGGPADGAAPPADGAAPPATGARNGARSPWYAGWKGAAAAAAGLTVVGIAVWAVVRRTRRKR